MKILFLLLLVVSTAFCHAQLSISGNEFKNGKLTAAEDRIYVLTLSSAKIPIDVTVQPIVGSASADDFDITGTNIQLNQGNGFSQPINVHVKKDAYDEKDESFKIKLSYSINRQAMDTTIVVEIPEPKVRKQTTKIMYLNAYNFDFNNTSSGNYVGHFNVFAPTLWSGANGVWGLNAGVMKINYSQNDSAANTRTRVENIYFDPFEDFSVGSKYIKQESSYKTEKRNTVWSFYAQPLLRLTSDKEPNQIFAHAHFELAAMKWYSRTVISAINQSKDTLIAALPLPYARSIKREVYESSSNKVFGYFGVGLTAHMQLAEKTEFFLQPTVGYTTNYPQPSSLDLAFSGRVGSGKNDSGGQWHGFYLVRSYFMQGLGENTEIVLGADIRGLLPTYPPQYSVYVGLNINLEALVKLLK